jgi:hypothetical protein
VAWPRRPPGPVAEPGDDGGYQEPAHQERVEQDPGGHREAELEQQVDGLAEQDDEAGGQDRAGRDDDPAGTTGGSMTVFCLATAATKPAEYDDGAAALLTEGWRRRLNALVSPCRRVP